MLPQTINQVSFREAEADDLAKIIELVSTHDEDDAEAIEESLQACQFENHFVAVLDDIVIGVTGFAEQPGCNQTFYLSWTYLHEKYCGKGYGNELMSFVIEQLKAAEARKVFIKISDYVDPENGAVYEAAMGLYKKFEFIEELKIEDYYDDGESLHILGLELTPIDHRVEFLEEKPNLKFTGMFQIQETESSYSFSWEESNWWKGSFGIQDIKVGLDAAFEDGAKRVVLSFPATYSRVHKILINAGFNVVGTLKDYYENGVDEIHYQIQF